MENGPAWASRQVPAPCSLTGRGVADPVSPDLSSRYLCDERSVHGPGLSAARLQPDGSWLLVLMWSRARDSPLPYLSIGLPNLVGSGHGSLVSSRNGVRCISWHPICGLSLGHPSAHNCVRVGD